MLHSFDAFIKVLLFRHRTEGSREIALRLRELSVLPPFRANQSRPQSPRYPCPAERKTSFPVPLNKGNEDSGEEIESEQK